MIDALFHKCAYKSYLSFGLFDIYNIQLQLDKIVPENSDKDEWCICLKDELEPRLPEKYTN